MNLTIQPTDLPRPLPVTPPPARGPKRLTLILGVTLGLAVIAIVAMAASITGDDSDAASTNVANAVDAGLGGAAGGAGNDDAGTGDATVDEQIVDAIWDGPSGKASICPAFREVAESMPSLSAEEIFDMGAELADMDDMAPAQLERMRELVLADC